MSSFHALATGISITFTILTMRITMMSTTAFRHCYYDYHCYSEGEVLEMYILGGGAWPTYEP